MVIPVLFTLHQAISNTKTPQYHNQNDEGEYTGYKATAQSVRNGYIFLFFNK